MAWDVAVQLLIALGCAVKATVEFVGSWQSEAMSERVAVWLCSNPYRPGEQLATQLHFRHNSSQIGVSSHSSNRLPWSPIADAAEPDVLRSW